MSTYSERLETIRLHLGLKKVEYSRKLGIPQQTYTKYGQGRTPNADFITKVHITFGVNCCWLLTGEGEMFPEDNDKSEVVQENIELKAKTEELEKQIKNTTNNRAPDIKLLEKLSNAAMEAVDLSREKRELQAKLEAFKNADGTKAIPDGLVSAEKYASLAMKYDELKEDHYESRKELTAIRAKYLKLTGDIARKEIENKQEKDIKNVTSINDSKPLKK